MPYNFVADSFHTKKLCSRLSSSEVRFYTENGLFVVLNSLWGLRDTVRCSPWAQWKARIGLPISVSWTFFARCYGWGATFENRSKIAYFAPTRPVWPKISGRRGRPHQSFLHGYLGQWMPYNFVADTVFTQRNSVADFRQAKCGFIPKTAFLWFWIPFGGLGATYDDHLRLIGKRVVELSC